MRVGMGCEMLIRSCRTQDLDKDDYIPEPYRKATAEEVHALHKKELQTRKHSDRVKQRKLQELGFEVEHTGEIIL
jgi:U6 snRNA-associated Sm-like protein LSm1